MASAEIQSNSTMLSDGVQKSMPETPRRDLGIPGAYDPELLYVECQICGKPVLWEAGRTTELLHAAGVDVSRLDERCMIVSAGCTACVPPTGEGYTLAVVRLAGLTPEEALHMTRPAGTA
jgi:hypothetical protein